MFKCLREISSQGMGAVGERLVAEVLKCAVSTVTGAARACDSGTVICHQSHKIQIKHTALKQGLPMGAYFSPHLQGSGRCLKESRAALRSRCLSYSSPGHKYAFNKEAEQRKRKRKKEGRTALSGRAKTKWRSTDKYSSLFPLQFLSNSPGAAKRSALGRVSSGQSLLAAAA